MGMHGRKRKKELLYERSNVCGVCGKLLSWSEANIDHVIPRSLGGGNDMANLQLTHFDCNSRKGNFLIATMPHNPDRCNLTPKLTRGVAVVCSALLGEANRD